MYHLLVYSQNCLDPHCIIPEPLVSRQRRPVSSALAPGGHGSASCPCDSPALGTSSLGCTLEASCVLLGCSPASARAPGCLQFSLTVSACVTRAREAEMVNGPSPRLTHSSPVRPTPRCRKPQLRPPAAERSGSLPVPPSSLLSGAPAARAGPGFEAPAQLVSRAHPSPGQQRAPVLSGGSWRPVRTHRVCVSVEPTSPLPWEGLVKERLPSAQETWRAVFRAPLGCVLPCPPKALSPWRGPGTCGCQHLGLGDPGLRPTQALLAFCAGAAGEAPARPLASPCPPHPSSSAPGGPTVAAACPPDES